MAAKQERMFIVRCNDGRETKITQTELDTFTTLKNLTEDCPSLGEAIPINIDCEIFNHIIKLIRSASEKNADITKIDRQLEDWEIEFLKNIEKPKVCYMLSGANFLDNKYVMHTVAKYIASTLKGKTTEQMREEWGIVNDFTEEEIDEIKKKPSYDLSIE